MTDAPAPERVRAAAAAWVWIPPEAVRVEGPEYLAVRFPDWFEHPLQLVRCGPGRDPAVVVDEVLERCARLDLGLDDRRMACWVRADSAPGLKDVLRQRGPLDEVVDVLARDIDEAFDASALAPPVDGVEVRWSDDAEVLVDAATVAAEVFGGKAPERASLLQKAPGEAEKVRHGGGGSVTAYVDGTPVGSAGLTVVGEDARLWGGAVRAAHRGRGIYRQLLAERLRYAVDRGARLAIVKGLVETSGPILRRAGFTPYHQERSYLLRF